MTCLPPLFLLAIFGMLGFSLHLFGVSRREWLASKCRLHEEGLDNTGAGVLQKIRLTAQPPPTASRQNGGGAGQGSPVGRQLGQGMGEADRERQKGECETDIEQLILFQ